MSSSTPTSSGESYALSVDEAVKFSGIGRTKFYELLNENKLSARKCGRRTLILKRDLEEFLDALPRCGTATNPSAVQS